jgi:hypothetical protein
VKTPSLIVLNGFLEDYSKQRSVAPSKSWGGKLTNAMSILSSSVNDKATKIENVLQTWERLSDSFAKTRHIKGDSVAAAQWVDIMLDLGNTAYIFQQSSSKRSRSSAALHAIRAYIYVTLNESSEGKEAIKAKIATLEAELRSIEKTKNDIPQDSSDIKHRRKLADEDHNNTLRSLAFLNVNKTRDKKELELIFPGYGFPPEVTRDSLPTFSQVNGINLNQNLPHILHENYTTLYINKIDDKENQKDDDTFISLEDYVKQRTQKFYFKYALDEASSLVHEVSCAPNTANTTSKSSLSSTAALAGTLSSTPPLPPSAVSAHKDPAQSHQPTPSNDAIVSDLLDSAASSSVTPPQASITPSSP